MAEYDVIYKFIEAKYVESTIANQWLKIATIDNLNDPYEMLPGYVNKKFETTAPVVQVMREMIIKLINPDIGILCFSKAINDPVMWAHYAERHRGVALEFRMPKGSFEEVKYRETRPIVESEDMKTFEAGDRVMFSKYKSWSYEKEYRQFTSIEEAYKENGIPFFEFERQFLTKIILGFDCEIDPEELRKLLEQHGFENTELARAQLDPKSYEMVIEPLK